MSSESKRRPGQGASRSPGERVQPDDDRILAALRLVLNADQHVQQLDRLTPMKRLLLAEGLRALARGWVLIPLRGKIPAISNWPDAICPNPETLFNWVRAGFNLGVVTGARSGVVVIDIDKGGEIDGLPPTWMAETGGGGRHCFYRYVPLGNSVGKLAPHVDVRGDGGQIVLVGSVHPKTGVIYAWAEGASPNDLPLADFPGWVLERLRKPAATPSPAISLRPCSGRRGWAGTAIDAEVERVRTASEGTRNNALNRAAFALGQIVAGGQLGETEVIERLVEVAEVVGLDQREIAPTIRSGLRAGAEHPRRSKPNPWLCFSRGRSNGHGR